LGREPITDEYELEPILCRIHGDARRPLLLPQDTFEMALIDAAKSVLNVSWMTMEVTRVSLELSRWSPVGFVWVPPGKPSIAIPPRCRPIVRRRRS
jgi:hypothetical protein